ncbi:sulfurtransferase TusA family protein [Candidatus Sumerlaeota bacterium]|nr:sulfurtransferase TusA family protein [Candidatus Sumerlaeota bacterium]
MAESTEIHFFIDVTSQACPMGFVKAKLALENLAVGQRLEVRLHGGEARHNIPRSFASEGQRLLGLQPEDGSEEAWRLIVERVH